MTKEELKQEAEEWLCNNLHSASEEDFINAMVEFAEQETKELKEKVSFLEDNLRVARKDREDLQLDVAKGLKEFVKDYPATALRYLANEKYVEQLTKAKEIIEKLKALYFSPIVTKDDVKRQDEILVEVEQFLSEVEKC